MGHRIVEAIDCFQQSRPSGFVIDAGFERFTEGESRDQFDRRLGHFVFSDLASDFSSDSKSF
jgi:hypothetical protein